MRGACFIFCLSFSVLAACRVNAPEDAHTKTDVDSLSSIQFPLLIEGGTKAVYQFGKMTPRGLKYFLDTIDVKSDQRIGLPDSLRLTFLSPLSMSGQERDTIPGIIAISRPGYWEETIFGKIDHTGMLHVNYIDEIQLAPASELSFKPGDWSGAFRKDSVTVRLNAVLSDTPDGEHLAGKGRLFLLDNNKLIEEHSVIIVFDKRSAIKASNNNN